MFSIFTLQRFTNFHAIRSRNFQNICNEIGWPSFLRHPVYDYHIAQRVFVVRFIVSISPLAYILLMSSYYSIILVKVNISSDRITVIMRMFTVVRTTIVITKNFIVFGFDRPAVNTELLQCVHVNSNLPQNLCCCCI